jgi:hypothetical protein
MWIRPPSDFLVKATALALSAVAGVYSIIGLTAIFPAAMVAVGIMTATLECAKIVTACWLRANWDDTHAFVRIYLVASVAVLMLITSTGVYSFLAKAHVTAQIEHMDTSSDAALASARLAAQRQVVDDWKGQIAYLDQTIQRVRAGSREWTAVQQRRSALLRNLNEAQTAIAKMTVETTRSNLVSKRAETDYGPLRFIATALYSSDDSEHLEAAVRWVNLLLIAVFDPLAIMLWIVATRRKSDTLGIVRGPRGRFVSQNQKPEPPAPEPPAPEPPAPEPPAPEPPAPEPPKSGDKSTFGFSIIGEEPKPIYDKDLS